MTDRDNDERVGYGRPPKKHRFRKGQSGNPEGRPRGSRNFDTEILEALRNTVRMKEQGKIRNVSSQKAILRRLIEKALNGDIRAIALVMSYAKQVSDEREGETSERRLTEAEFEILNRVLGTDGTEPEYPEEDGEGEGSDVV
ncbi:hypothetical protein GV827_16105 [Sulfitobacter sp. JBTF-M27]|uniref:DUF5681 domain-containing protein n=1 Tax=Sulfitobacter sediminilitoris TaxID=2698830 RepID=A0A6P0CFR9_9RHOB|nr:DUF5681 domain-containing protein [Sulfitobacter sediminilitoris]NEK23916.1 hypothetical protein [Sulfitobacter sediminilitoris]